MACARVRGHVHRSSAFPALEQGMTWDGPNVIRGNTGERGFGNDYCQNMIMWAYPAALVGGDIAVPTKPSELVDRVLRAAQAR